MKKSIYDNHIEIYKNDNGDIFCGVVGIADLTGFTSQFSAKIKETDTSVVMTLSGLVSDPSGTLLFHYTTTDSSLFPRDYSYDVHIDGNGIHKTIVKDVLTILEIDHVD